MRRQVEALVISCAVLTAASLPCTFYVAPSGSDTSPGTLSSPFRTLSRAASALRGLPRPLASPALACLRGGRYFENITLGALDSGTSPAAPAGFVAFPNEAPEVVGSLPVTFSPLPPGDPAWAHLPPGVGPFVVVASLAAAGLPHPPSWGAWAPQGGVSGCKGPPLELLVGAGSAQVPARWPNAAPGGWGGAWATTVPSWRSAPDRFEAELNASFLAWSDVGDVWFHGHWWWDWNDYYLPAAGWDARTGEVRVAAPLPSGNLSGAARYYAFGSLSALDAAGEYHLNRSSGVLYWFPPPDADTRSASVSVLPTLVSGVGVANFLLGGLTFWGARGTAVDFSGGANVSVVNCTVAHAGLHGIVVSGSGGNLVQGSEVRGTGGRGVSVYSTAPHAQLTPAGDRVIDNNVHDFERVCLTYAFGVAASGPGVAVERNEVFNSGHACATIEGNNALFRWNVLHHCTMDTFDNGALYWYPNDWTRQNVTVAENFAYLNGFASTPCNFRTSCLRASMYMDNGGAGATFFGNVIWQPSPGGFPVDAFHSAPKWVAINNDGGRNTLIANNLVVDATNTTYNSGGGLAWASFGQLDNSSVLYAEMRAVNWSTGAFAASYPALAALQDFVAPAPRCRDNPRCPPAPFGNAVARNVVVNASGVLLVPPGEAVFNASNFNVTNNLFNVDPLFVQADPRAALDFELAPGSPAYTVLDPPFQRIRRECFGPWSGC
jgi:hypothetical protein